jgi:hypothetical protein
MAHDINGGGLRDGSVHADPAIADGKASQQPAAGEVKQAAVDNHPAVGGDQAAGLGKGVPAGAVGSHF